MFFLKPLLLVLGGATGIAGFSSLSSLDWDPSNVWRAGSKKKFYLFTCGQRQAEEDKKPNAKWIYSDLKVYLTIAGGGNSEVNDQTKLQLVGEGYYKKFRNKDRNVEFLAGESGSEKEVDLHKDNGSSETWFVFTVGAESKNNWLGETGGGVDSNRYGELVMCNKKLFTFEKYERPSSAVTGNLSADLLKVKFSLEKCGDTENNYKGQRGCSIKIDSGDKGLQWADGFKPIVI